MPMRRLPLTNNNKKQKEGTAQSLMRRINSHSSASSYWSIIYKMTNLVQNHHSSDKDIPNSNNVHKTIRDRTITKQIPDLGQAHTMEWG